jgi:hypothetical protein
MCLGPALVSFSWSRTNRMGSLSVDHALVNMASLELRKIRFGNLLLWWFKKNLILFWFWFCFLDGWLIGWFFKIGSHSVAQAVLILITLLPQPPMCWGYRFVPLRLPKSLTSYKGSSFPKRAEVNMVRTKKIHKSAYCMVLFIWVKLQSSQK